MTTRDTQPVPPIDRDRLQERLLTALAANRAPGFHFPGYFLQTEWPRMGGMKVEQVITAGPCCVDANGIADPCVIGVHVDGALATAPRLVIQPGARLATVHMNIQYTGHAPRGALLCESTMEGFFVSDAVRQAISRAVLTSQGQVVCYATGTFALLPPPEGVKLAPLPWQSTEDPPPPLEMSELDAKERGVMRAAEQALERADGEHAFIERFWGNLPKTTASGATSHVPIGAQIGNRVGHVQGGVLIGLAQSTAAKAVPKHPAISNISAWYISPGHGKELAIRSSIVHAGRSFAVVRTEIKNADGKLVLEAVTNHAAR